MKVLIIDDDHESCFLLSKFIKINFQGDVTLCHSGEEALYLLLSDEKHFDLIFLDIVMPNMNGIDTCMRIRENESYLYTPILFVSASQEPDHMMNAFFSGGTDFLHKPLNLLELQTRTRLALKTGKEKAAQMATIKRQSEVIDRLNRLLEQLKNRVHYDPITDILSRNYLNELIQNEWMRHKRSQMAMALVFVQIDGMNSETRKAIAKSLDSSFQRAADFVGVWNDNTFAILLVDSVHENFLRSTDLILLALQSHPSLPHHIGLSACIPPLNAGTPQDLIEGTQAAIFDAKNKKSGTVSFKEVIFSQPKPLVS